MGVIETILVEKLLDLFLEAAGAGVRRIVEKHKLKNRLQQVVAAAFKPLSDSAEWQQISAEKCARLAEACAETLRPLTVEPKRLLEGSLDGQKLFERLDTNDEQTRMCLQTVGEDGTVNYFSQLLPVMAEALGRLLTQSPEWEHLQAAEILGRMDTLQEELRDTYQATQRIEQTTSRTDQTTQRIEQKVDGLIDRLPPDTLSPPSSPLLTSLPPRAEHFTGREKELSKLLGLLRAGCRVTLVAAGGMGKTALALEALHVLLGEDASLRIANLQDHYGRLGKRFPHGLFYYTFYHQKEADLCLEAIARAFGEQPLPNAQEAARRALAGKRALLYLDGAEETQGLPAILEVCGGCGVLVTTRRRRDAAGGEAIPVRLLPADKSLRLLKKWAGKFALDEGGGTASAREIIHLTGGLPLATTIVGRYLSQKEEPAAEYVRRLRGVNLEALSQGERQKESVPLLIQRSLAQVPEESCRLLALSSALAYLPFPLDLLWAGLPELKTETQKRGALDPLLDYGLLVRVAGQLYQLAHLLLYAYARKELPVENGRLLSLARYGVALAKREVPRGPQGFRSLDAYRPHLVWLETRLLRLEGEEGEVSEALGLVSVLAWALYKYLELDGRWAEWLDSMRTALAAARLVGDRQGEGRHLGNLGNAYSSLGQYDKAIEHHRQALGIAREIPADRQMESAALGNLGVAYKNLGQYGKAIEHHRQALGIAREIGDRAGEGAWLGNLGSAYGLLGEYGKAIEHYQFALAITRQIGDRRGEGNCLGGLGSSFLSLGQYGEAIDHFRLALEIARAIGDRQGEGMHLGNLGSAYEALGQNGEAIDHFQLALAIARAIGDRAGEGRHLGNLGNAFYSLGQYKEAIDHFQQALAITRQIGDRRGEGQDLGNLGNAYGSLGQNKEAIDHYRQALEIDREIGDIAGEATDLANLGLLHEEQGDLPQARQCWQQALQIYEQIGSPHAGRVRGWLEQH
jgi:tetratricopeptide (TPR) repeat protein